MEYRIVLQGSSIGSNIRENPNSHGLYHGEVYVVQTLSDEGPASAWEFTAAFATLDNATNFKNSLPR